MMLWYGSELRGWVLEGGRPVANRAAAGWLRARGFEACRKMQSALKASPLSAPPVIIGGLWRTGTTLLHEMLAAAGGFATPTTWQCLRPASFRLAKPGREMDVLRPMDGLRVSTNSPQEDEFALLLLGAPSLYRGFLDPRRLGELADALLAGDDETFLEPWLGFLSDVQAEQPGRLLLKSPNHLFRLEAIRRAVPDTQVILTVRDPVEVYWSNLRMWSEMVSLHGHWSAPDGAIEAFVSRAMTAAAAVFTRMSEVRGPAIPAVSFDRLVADPAGVTLSLLERLFVPITADVEARVYQEAASRSGHLPRSDRRDLPREAASAADALSAATKRLLTAG